MKRLVLTLTLLAGLVASLVTPGGPVYAAIGLSSTGGAATMQLAITSCNPGCMEMIQIFLEQPMPGRYISGTPEYA